MKKILNLYHQIIVFIIIQSFFEHYQAQLNDPQIYKVKFNSEDLKNEKSFKEVLFLEEFSEIPSALIGISKLQIHSQSIDFLVKLTEINQKKAVVTLTKGKDNVEILNIEINVLILPKSSSIYIHELSYKDLKPSDTFSKDIKYKNPKINQSNFKHGLIFCYLTGLKSQQSKTLDEDFSFSNDVDISVKTKETNFSLKITLGEFVDKVGVSCNCFEFDFTSKLFFYIQKYFLLTDKPEAFKLLKTNIFYGQEVIFYGITSFKAKPFKNYQFDINCNDLNYSQKQAYVPIPCMDPNQSQQVELKALVIQNRKCQNDCTFQCAQGFYRYGDQCFYQKQPGSFCDNKNNCQFDDPQIFKIKFNSEDLKNEKSLKEVLFPKEFNDIPSALIGISNLQIHSQNIDFLIKLTEINQKKAVITLTKGKDNVEIPNIEINVLVLPKADSINIHELNLEDQIPSNTYSKDIQYKNPKINHLNYQKGLVYCYLTGLKSKQSKTLDEDFSFSSSVELSVQRQQTSFSLQLKLGEFVDTVNVSCNCFEFDFTHKPFNYIQKYFMLTSYSDSRKIINPNIFYGSEVIFYGITSFSIKPFKNYNFNINCNQLIYSQKKKKLKVPILDTNPNQSCVVEIKVLIIQNSRCQNDCTFQCAKGYYNYQDECINQMLYSSYCDDKNNCTECGNKKCLTCENDGISCLSCQEGKYLSQKDCHDSRPKDYYCFKNSRYR